MRDYQVYKIKGNSDLEPMGTYHASTGQKAINKMGESGNLSGSEWAMEYVAIPNGVHFRKLKVK